MAKRLLQCEEVGNTFGMFRGDQGDRFLLGLVALMSSCESLIALSQSSKRMHAEVEWIVAESTMVESRPEFFILNLLYALHRATDKALIANAQNEEKELLSRPVLITLYFRAHGRSPGGNRDAWTTRLAATVSKTGDVRAFKRHIHNWDDDVSQQSYEFPVAFTPPTAAQSGEKNEFSWRGEPRSDEDSSGSELSSDTDEEGMSAASSLSFSVPLLVRLLGKVVGAFNNRLDMSPEKSVLVDLPMVLAAVDSDSARRHSRDREANLAGDSHGLGPVRLPRTTFKRQNGSDSDEYNTLYSSIEIVVEALERLDGLAMTTKDSDEYFREMRRRRRQDEKARAEAKGEEYKEYLSDSEALSSIEEVNVDEPPQSGCHAYFDQNKLSEYSDGITDPADLHAHLYGKVCKRFFWARQIATRDVRSFPPIWREKMKELEQQRWANMKDCDEDESEEGEKKRESTRTATLYDLARLVAGMGSCEEESEGKTLSARGVRKFARGDDPGRAYFTKHNDRLPNYL